MNPSERDGWWMRHFSRLLDMEESGRLPRELERRWLLLASRTWPDRRWQVTFDVPDNIYHVLDDADVRSEDARYADRQRAEARRWIDA